MKQKKKIRKILTSNINNAVSSIITKENDGLVKDLKLAYLEEDKDISTILNKVRQARFDELTILTKYLKKCSKQTYKYYTDLELDEDILVSILYAKWVDDGLTYKDRINTLSTNLYTDIENAFKSNSTYGKFTEEIERKLRQHENSIIRITNTEMERIQVDTSLQSFKDMGYTQYMYLTAGDDKVCADCAELNEKIFNIDEAVIGVNCPCMHPNCRCQVIPIK